MSKRHRAGDQLYIRGFDAPSARWLRNESLYSEGAFHLRVGAGAYDQRMQQGFIQAQRVSV